MLNSLRLALRGAALLAVVLPVAMPVSVAAQATGAVSTSYPSDIRAGAGFKVQKQGLSLRISADYSNVPLMTTTPAAGNVLVQDPATGEFNRLDLSSLPTTVPRDGSVTIQKFSAAPAFSFIGNATSVAAQPQYLNPTQAKSALALGQVDNTSDAAKPISTAQAAALNAKAPIASPIFTGTATAPTIAITGTGSTGDVSAMIAPPNPSAAANTLSRLLADRQTTTYTPDLGPGIAGAQRSVAEALDSGYIDARALGFRSCLSDCAAALAANNAAVANLGSKLSAIGGTIFFRRGIWPLSQTIAIADKHFGIVGEGEGRTYFQFTGNGHLFDVSESSLFYRVEFRGFTAWASSAGSDKAIRIIRPLGNSSTQSGPNIRNIEFVGSDTTQYQWQTGIDCTGCWNLNVTENLFQGKDNAFSADFLILRDRSTPPTIVNNKVFSANRAVWSPPGSFVEGLIAIANQFVGVNYGIFLDDGGNAPGAQIIGNHINAFRAAVVSIARPQILVSKNLFYRYGDASQGFDWIGVFFGTASSDATVVDNLFYGYRGQYPGSATAVAGSLSTAGSVVGGMIADCDIGIQGNNTWAVAYDRIKTRNVTTPVQSLGAGSFSGTLWPF